MNIITVLSNAKALLKKSIVKRLIRDPTNRTRFHLGSYSGFISFLSEKLSSITDPNRKDFYIKWIATRYAQGKAQVMEDVVSKAIPDIKEYHELYRRNKLKTEHRDLSRVRSSMDLSDLVESYEEKDEPAEEGQELFDHTGAKEFFDSGEAKLIYNKEISILRIKSYKASCFFGTRDWCLVRKQDDWNEYIRMGNRVYFILFPLVKRNAKHTEAMWAFLRNQKRIWESTLWNGRDNEPDPTPKELFYRRMQQYPVLKKLFKGTVFGGKVSDKYLAKMLASLEHGVPEGIRYVPRERINR